MREKLFFVLTLLSKIKGGNGFADNLVVSPLGCMTELDDSEIIMNNIVKTPEKSDFPRMHLAVVEGDNHMESPYHYSSDELTIAFVNPYTREEFQDDLQFVMEVEGPAKFVAGGTIGCDGNRRVSSRMHGSSLSVQLKINDVSANLRLWAGWATGQEAVRLTPNLVLEPHSAAAIEGEQVDSTGKDEDPILKDENKKEENFPAGNPELNGNEDAAIPAGDELGNSEPENPVLNERNNNNGNIESSDPSEKLEKIERIKKFQQKGDVGNLYDGGTESDREKSFDIQSLKHILRKTHTHPVHQALHLHRKVHEFGKSIHHKYFYDEESQQSFRQKYDSDEFAGQLDTQRHLVGSLFFLTTMVYILFIHGRRPGVKGRRDL